MKAASAGTVSVDVGIPTYKLPKALATLLESLLTIKVPANVRVAIIVVDNDIQRSAQSVVEAFATINAFPVRYFVEERIGVVHVRNRLLDLATNDLLAMIDDDQYASPAWLEGLIETMEQNNADAVIGEVEPLFPRGAPGWLIACHGHRPAINQARLVTGSTNNALLRRSSILSRNLRFDPQFSLTGGEDTDFFYRLHCLGGSIYSSTKAKLFDPIDPSRLTIRWYATRNFRVGQTNAIVFKTQSPQTNNILLMCGRGVAGFLFLAVGGAIFLFQRSFGAKIILAGLRNIGYASTLFGFRTIEYGNH
jgi:succinoglycan biosynthesis protein ExoM